MRNLRSILSLVILTVFLVAPKANAMASYSSGGSSGFKIKPDIMYLYDYQGGTNGSGITTTRLLGNLSLGYVFADSPFYLGGIYSYDSKSSTGNSQQKDTFNSYGLTVGLLTDNVYMLFSYFLSSQYDQIPSTGGSTTSYTSGSGFQVALGYLFTISSGVQIGPELDYRSLSYTQIKNPNGTTGSASLTANTLVPYISLVFSL